MNQCYITWLEIGGSHAHRLKPLIEHLGLLTLIVTDLDAGDPAKKRKASQPIKGNGLQSNNTTIRTWIPKESDIDKLAVLPEDDKIYEGGPLFAIRVVYQTPVKVAFGGAEAEVTPYTFEDAIVFDNLAVIKGMTGTGLTGVFAKLVNTEPNAASLAEKLFKALDGGKKADFALDLMELATGPEALHAPSYIAEGLSWLEGRLRSKRAEVVTPVLKAAEIISDVLTATSVAGSDRISDNRSMPTAEAVSEISGNAPLGEVAE